MFVRVLHSFHGVLQQLCAVLPAAMWKALWNSALALSEHATAYTALKLGPASANRPALHGRGETDRAECFAGFIQLQQC